MVTLSEVEGLRGWFDSARHDIARIAFLLVSIVLLLCNTVAFAQQKPLFTQYVFNDYYYNPAVASTKEGADFRALYRHQWAGLEGQPQTATFSSCGSLKKFPLGIGGNIYYDKTGPLGNFGFNVSGSYGIRIKKESMISAGISFGMIRFAMENDVTARDANPDVAVLAAQDGKIIPDISLGIYYKWKGLYAGFSIPQIVQSDIKLEVDDPEEMNKLIRHYFIAAGYRFNVSDKFQLEPSVLLKAVKAAPLQSDITLRGIYDKMVWLGLSYRTGDAVCVFAGVLIKEMFEVGYAYDITTSNLNSVSNGSHEIVLGYSFKRTKSGSGSKGFEVR
ncbi:MAG: type IX secretion system membrane protein PorP/SprF [Chitinophagales bacterium]|nr:type IX secretion system membrane protein PorP/SprF [Chitinophagales bacterium]